NRISTLFVFFFFSSRRRHTRSKRDWSSDVCSSDLELTTDETFWKGCQSCPNYDILTDESRKGCLCTGMLYDPKQHNKQSEMTDKRTRWKKFKRFLRLHQRHIQRKTKKILNNTSLF